VRRLLNQTEREAIKKQFDSFDKDGNGAISPSELALVMKAIGETTSEEEIKKIIAEVDINQNGTIEFNEFVEVCKWI
jgi:Ca2+-binding EF-hand superfamily protein